MQVAGSKDQRRMFAFIHGRDAEASARLAGSGRQRRGGVGLQRAGVAGGRPLRRRRGKHGYSGKRPKRGFPRRNARRTRAVPRSEPQPAGPVAVPAAFGGVDAVHRRSSWSSADGSWDGAPRPTTCRPRATRSRRSRPSTARSSRRPSTSTRSRSRRKTSRPTSRSSRSSCRARPRWMPC